MPNEDGTRNWFDLHPKVKAALYALFLANAASLALVVQGTESWRDFVVGAILSAITWLTAYMKTGDTEPPADPGPFVAPAVNANVPPDENNSGLRP